ncbi:MULTISPECIES: SMI1/KNR4 family protein [unclassified Streptomyces]|uniref:SMI1/KNR4 family protein n=1 Tax=unclassified Streptomyces TaxID=2593676 RepID=UPI00336A6CEC
MGGNDSVAALAPLIPVAGGVDERIDWSEVEGIWGRRFPSDYVRFMEVYGAGLVSGEIVMLLPVPRPGTYTDGTGLGDETENARLTWEMCGDDVDFEVDPGSIVAWGVTTGADIYCWLTTDEDPDKWPVLVCGRHTSPSFQVHPFGMAEFLRRLLGDAEFQEETISVTLPEEGSFVNWREQQRRLDADLNPATGRPWY